MLDVIGVNIRKKRKERGYSQEKLAFKAGIDRSYMGYIENGKYNITILKLDQIARALDVSISDLIY
ncbi:helix-turn-helix transcriptional regulator [Carboxylicivirga sp. A043]|jgi:transcriptional regulator with XRE-family HTH domain|uniref:helix-turn-helix domain-containing protein n=1 Tax=Carboxylicivirga TaxID=1628153 RepID=UPI0021CB5661|nr:helix-turn-helix transcriptional regulator [Carboxylicivirga sp. A043]MCG8580682.1 helix-turn-helix transcriptional regulator [Bacteroidales bacterium]MCU4157463.1 helix-turn-helix transcriptional regulator [Carboxylicivirga sp. A043]